VPEARYRVAASCGVAFTAFMVAAASLVPTAPEYDSGPAAIRDYLTKHHAELGLSTVLTGAATLFLISFFGFVIRRLEDADPEGGTLPATFQLAAAAVATSLLFATILEAALAQRIGARADDPTLQALYAVWLLAFHTAPSMATIVALLVTAIAIVRWHVFPSWLAVAATLAAALTLLDNVSDLATSGTSLGPLGLIAFATVNVWILGIALTGIRARTTSHNAVAYRQAEPGAS
jgi:hypothetical protein